MSAVDKSGDNPVDETGDNSVGFVGTIDIGVGGQEVVMRFGHRVAGIGMTPQQAVDVGVSLITVAGEIARQQGVQFMADTVPIPRE